MPLTVKTGVPREASQLFSMLAIFFPARSNILSSPGFKPSGVIE